MPLRSNQRGLRARHHPLQRKARRLRRPHHVCGDPRSAQRGSRVHEGLRIMSVAYTVPLFVRGEVTTDDVVTFGTRAGDAQFAAPDMARHVHRLPLPTPAAMADLHDLPFDEILDLLEALGDALD